VVAPGSRNLEKIDITSEDCRKLLASLETRVRGLHPALRSIEFTHRWGGPILFRESWVPVFDRHPKSDNAVVLGAYAGHGVALSSYLGTWAAEAVLGRRDLPEWGRIDR
jgi:glycine/D-amino acid oxidase-like deaminating enzyme